jgi:hypothetical protein
MNWFTLALPRRFYNTAVKISTHYYKKYMKFNWTDETCIQNAQRYCQVRYFKESVILFL